MIISGELRHQRWIPWLGALLVGGFATILFHRHQFASGFDLFPGPRGDTRVSAYVCEHWYRVLQGKVALFSPTIFYPVRGTLGYADAMLLFVPPYALLRAVGLNIFTALGVVVVLFNFLNFVAGFTLLFQVLRYRWLASVAGAMFFAYNNPKLTQLDNVQLQAIWLLPVSTIGIVLLFRNVRSFSGRRTLGLLSLAGLTLNVQLLTGFYLGWFLIFWSGLFFVVLLCLKPARELLTFSFRRHWRSILGAAAITVVALIPFLLLYLPVQRGVPDWPYQPHLMHIPKLQSYLFMADGNIIWSRVLDSLQSTLGGPEGWDRGIGIGLVGTLAWLGLSVIALRSRASHPFLFASIIAVDLLILITLQYHGHSLWHKVYALVPGGKAIRDVARFMIFAALPMGIVFAAAADRAERWVGGRPERYALLVGVIAFGLLEQFTTGEGQYYSSRAEIHWLESLAAKLPAGCTAFYVTGSSAGDPAVDAYHNRQWMHDAMFVSVLRDVPTLNGRSSKSPPGWQLREVTAPEYESRVRDWVERHHMTGRICRLQVRG